MSQSVWYVDVNRAAINWSTAVVGNVATINIHRLVQQTSQGGATIVNKYLWAAAGQTVTADQVAAAQAETSGSPIPTEYVYSFPQGRFVGVFTTPGPPTAGTYMAYDYGFGKSGNLWVCVQGGSPGVWMNPHDTTMGLAAGEATVPRHAIGANPTLPSGNVRLTYFEATKTETINNLTCYQGNTPGVVGTGGVQNNRMGVYTVDGSGNLTLVAATAAGNGTLFTGAAGSAQTAALTTPLAKQAGQWYAVAQMFYTTGTGPTTPTIVGVVASNSGTPLGENPRMAGTFNNQTDLPASIPAGSVTANSQLFYVELTP